MTSRELSPIDIGIEFPQLLVVRETGKKVVSQDLPCCLDCLARLEGRNVTPLGLYRQFFILIEVRSAERDGLAKDINITNLKVNSLRDKEPVTPL